MNHYPVCGRAISLYGKDIFEMVEAGLVGGYH
jgi:hypothetical protein